MDNESKVSKLIEENGELKNALSKLQETQEQLIQAEKLASIGRLSAGIAHEINNPIGFVSSNSTTLTGYVNRIKEILNMYRAGIKKEIIEKREKRIKLDFILEDIDKLIIENIEGLARITNIVSNLKKFSRDDSLNEFIDSNINDGLRSVLVILKNEIKYCADVATDLGDIAPIPCNMSELNQVFLNIIVNAAQAIKEQKRDDKGTISVKTYQDCENVYCEIGDDGPGVPDKVKRKIFDPFFTTKEVGIGTGLGLSISYEIVVNKHKGDLTIDTNNGKGTLFIITLPRHRGESDV
ncbi:ATP-binding protein [Chitinispirillales bacterium ANBcel5]|uniref:sensor histidine kinase n=1 Tax=Cellulosispirillum alkaliphilum TaxID=3039283 RepID=UPI002A54D225|nr:ATP-binding protein [Chitinispirillales bacterium ANBcel5]